MKKLIVTLLITLIYNITSAQTGWGYVNYTSYKTHAGNGSLSQYGQFAYDAAQFDNMLNTANSNTTITHTGEVPLSYIYSGSTQTPHWNADYYAIKFDFWFVPQETGIYYFGINSDDASDLFIDGSVVATYYGGHGASGYQTGSKAMVAGQRYKVVVRYQEYGGGDALYFRWYRPVSGTWGYWNNEVTNIDKVPTKQARINFDFGSTLNKTTFSIGSKALGSNGWVDVTNSLDSNKISNGYKATITPGQVEWSLINPYEASRNGHRLQIDERVFGGTGINLNDIKSVKLFDIYEGPITPMDFNGWWKQWVVPGSIDLASKVAASSFQSNIRLQDGWYAFKADYSFSLSEQYKPQSITMTTTNTVSTLYNSIVTVSDVYMAFKELANGGIFGNQTGNEFTYGIQYKNADINDDGVFDESDCFRLLQHLTGVKNIVDTFNLRKTLKLIPTSAYNSITKSNWNTSPSYLGDTYNFDINTDKATDTINLSGTWKGDVNLSHSAIPVVSAVASNSVKTFSTPVSNEVQALIMTELIGDTVYVTVNVNPLQQELVGTQFKLNYDNSLLKFNKVTFKTKGNPTNFGTDKGDYINFGSLITDGSTLLDNTTEYVITLAPTSKLNNILGLISVYFTDAVNKTGSSLKVKVN